MTQNKVERIAAIKGEWKTKMQGLCIGTLYRMIGLLKFSSIPSENSETLDIMLLSNL